uniref:Uncharacterized protein n=1 Tax=Manihot esculenta TaxID=3983 RepID=A0A2C9V6T7_MANES
MELKIFSRDIHFPGETDKISRHSDILIPPGTVKTNSKELKKVKNWIYIQRITPTKKKYFVLVRSVIIYEIANGINLETLFPQVLLQEKDNMKFRVVNYILYGTAWINGADHRVEGLYLFPSRNRSCSAYPALIEVGFLRLPGPSRTVDMCPDRKRSYILYIISDL